MWTNTLSLRTFFMLGLALQCVHAVQDQDSSSTTVATISSTDFQEPILSVTTIKMTTLQTASSAEMSDITSQAKITEASTSELSSTHDLKEATFIMTSTTLSPVTSQTNSAAQTEASVTDNTTSNESTPTEHTTNNDTSPGDTITAITTNPISNQRSETTTIMSNKEEYINNVTSTEAKSEEPLFTATSTKSGEALSTTVSETTGSVTVITTNTTTALLTATKTLSSTASSTTLSNKPAPEVEVIINGNRSNSFPELPRLQEVCSELLRRIQMAPTGKCNMNVRQDANELNFISIELAADPGIADKIYNDIKKKEDENKSVNDEIPKTMIAIASSIGALVLILILFAIYCSCHRRSYRKNQQHLTEELQTVENGYHDNPTLEVMEVQPEMQEKKLALNGEFNDSWIVPYDLTKEIADEEDTHL